MKSRVKELLDRSVQAMISAIEIYNKPNFFYKEETFAILAINSWELLLKAKWLKYNNNNIRSLYVFENYNLKDGSKSKQKRIRRTRSGNEFTHSINYLGNKLVDINELDPIVWKNIESLIEIRDSVIHFYNFSTLLSIRLQEIGVATLKNYINLINEWFNKDLTKYNFHLMPLSFVSHIDKFDAVILNKEEKNFLRYLDKLEYDNDSNSPYSITVKIDVNFVKSKSKGAAKVKISNDPDATKIILTEEQIREKYPWDYQSLTDACRERYVDFKANRKYHDIRNRYKRDVKYVKTRLLDPSNPNGSKKDFYNTNILKILDEHYVKMENMD